MRLPSNSPGVSGLTGSFFSNLPPPPCASPSAANFFNASIVIPFWRADSSVAWRKTLKPHHTKDQQAYPTKHSKAEEKGGGRRGERTGKAYFGTTGSLSSFAASIASLHLAVQRHHLHPGSSPIDRRLLPREAEKSRNSFVRTPASERSELMLVRVA